MLKRIGLLVGCALLLVVAWMAVLSMKSPLEKQTELVALADAEIRAGFYANAEPYLLSAVDFNTKNTQDVMERLKTVYRSLNSPDEYAGVLRMQTDRADCLPVPYSEYARFLIDDGKLEDALGMLRLGIVRTGDAALSAYYERERYAFSLGHDIFEDVTTYHSNGIQVQMDGLWGLANDAGTILIPCEYLQISTFDSANRGSVVVMQEDGSIIAVNLKNRMVAKTDLRAAKIGNYSQGFVSLQLPSGKWILADSNLATNNAEFIDIGICANSALALNTDGKWGVVSLDSKIILPYEFDGIVMDELGRCAGQNAIFAKKDGVTCLYVDGKPLDAAYEDARPFNDAGWAAVKKNGKWGFIDIKGQWMIEPRYDDALSFSGYFAAVKQGELWGYLATNGKMVIEPQFLGAKSFLGSYAPVLTEDGYRFLSLADKDTSIAPYSDGRISSSAAGGVSVASEELESSEPTEPGAPEAEAPAASESETATPVEPEAPAAYESETSAEYEPETESTSDYVLSIPLEWDASDLLGQWSIAPGYPMDTAGGIEFNADGTFTALIASSMSLHATISETSSEGDATIGAMVTQKGNYAVLGDTLIFTNVTASYTGEDESESYADEPIEGGTYQVSIELPKDPGYVEMFPDIIWLVIQDNFFFPYTKSVSN